MEFVIKAVFVATNNCDLIEQVKKKAIIKEKLNFFPPTQGKNLSSLLPPSPRAPHLWALGGQFSGTASGHTAI